MIWRLFIVMTIMATLSCGQNDPLSTYEPKTPQEQALKVVLLDFEAGVNNRDSNQIINLIHEKAAIMTGRDRKILSRAEYNKILPQRLADNPPVALGKPKMTVGDDKAEVKVYMTRGNYNGLVVFNMKLENNKWYIHGWKY